MNASVSLLVSAQEMATNPNEYPWDGESKTLDFHTDEAFQFFLTALSDAYLYLLRHHHFDGIGSLLQFHSKFQSTPGAKLEDIWKDLHDVDLSDGGLSCAGLALVLKDKIVSEHPEWEDHLALAVSNEWTRKEPAPETFWTSSTVPSFPLQCREHVLLFTKVSLNDGRKAVVMLNPGRNIGIPLVVTEDGLPPQTPVLDTSRLGMKRFIKTSWAGQDFVKWIMETTRNGILEKREMRIFVSRRFVAWKYLDWYNLLYPNRAFMTMTASKGISSWMRTAVGDETAKTTIFLLHGYDGSQMDVSISLDSTEKDYDIPQRYALKRMCEITGKASMEQTLMGLRKIFKDKDFRAQMSELWDRGQKEREATFDSLIC